MQRGRNARASRSDFGQQALFRSIPSLCLAGSLFPNPLCTSNKQKIRPSLPLSAVAELWFVTHPMDDEDFHAATEPCHLGSARGQRDCDFFTSDVLPGSFDSGQETFVG